MPFQDVDLEKLYSFGRFLLSKLPKTDYTDRLKLKYAFEEVFIQTLIDRMKDNEEIFDKIMGNNEFNISVKEWLTKKIYQRFNKQQ